MGFVARVEHVMDSPSVSDEDAQNLMLSTKQVLMGEMGTKFKAIAITHPNLSTPGFQV
jgi:hypothetical protein